MGVMAGQLAIRGAMAESIDDFGAWMMSEQRRVFLLCLRMLQDREEADSATQEVFLKAYRAMQKPGRELEDASKWVSRIAVNTCLDLLRSRRWQFWKKRLKEEDERLVLENRAGGAPDAEDLVFARQIDSRLRAAIHRLSDRQRAVFTLRHYEDRTLDEIGEILGLDTGTVKAHMSRAVAKLRGDLRDLYAGLPAR